MIIDSKVYDVTEFLDDHPGGEDILIDSSGRDATREFEDVGHSQEARGQLSDLCIGKLREATEEEKEQAAREAEEKGTSLQSKGSDSMFNSIARWLLPIVIIGVALLLRKYVN